MKQILSNVPDNFLTEPRSSQQSCHVIKSKPLITYTPLQVNKPQNLIQSLNGLCKYFNKKDEMKQITYFAPKSVQRSSASLSPRQIITSSISDNSPVLVKQLLCSQKYLKENLNPKEGISITEFKSDQKLMKVNDSSHKRSMGRFAKNQKSRNASVQYHEDWKLKYEDLQQSLCQRIQQLENELEEMEKNRKIDRMHSDEQTNQYIEQLQSIIAEKDQVIYQMDQKHQELEQIIQKQQQEIDKYRQNNYRYCDNLEIKRLQIVDQQFQKLKGQLPVLASTLQNIEQILDTSQTQQNNMSLSSVSVVEMINEMNQGIGINIQSSNRNNELLIRNISENKPFNLSDILSRKKNQ
ncbi:unnamed protein product [Paramecium primaurelia]|uniref:Uncharacterized protein n=1 Tax=Paramecium primaurelia TaxID=5886 RepID=A0A8S1NJE5_PARPR|nr:unnamed protein product [Paramecium primaurelia]